MKGKNIRASLLVNPRVFKSVNFFNSTISIRSNQYLVFVLGDENKGKRPCSSSVEISNAT